MLGLLVLLKTSSPASGDAGLLKVLYASTIQRIDNYLEASAACAAANLATGTRRGEQLT